jgi:Icc protein
MSTDISSRTQIAMSIASTTGQTTPDATAAGGASSSHGPRPIRVLQLTDLHLYADPEGRLLGQNTRRTFEMVIELAEAKHWPPDVILLTGDLIHDEHIASYRFLKERLVSLQVPCHCIPGNHDRVDLLGSHLDPDAAADFRTRPLGPWELALLDSTIPGEEGGRLQQRSLDGLDRHLTEHPTRPTLVCLHHQPVPVGSRWMDSMMVENGAALLALARRHENLRGIIWGHVHQAFREVRHDTLLLATPSTCVQFMPAAESFALDPLPPGYRWLTLHPDGAIDTGIERIGAYPDPLEQRSHGY